MKEIKESELDELRGVIFAQMSQKRFSHTVAVETMVGRLCALYCPEYTDLMRAAALLHDVTKELTLEEQLQLCSRYGLQVTQEEKCAPKTLHARTAAEKIRSDFPQFADPIIVNAVRWHTTGHANMTLTEKLLYLADYIDDSRTFQNCVLLRRYFFGADPASLSKEKREELLRDTLILSYDMTVRDPLSDGQPVAIDTVMARNDLIVERVSRP